MTEITCKTALDRMLEAAPAELRGHADTELAAHIAGCNRCRAVSTAMLEELDVVDDAMGEYATGGPTFAAGSDAAADAHAGADPHAAADAAADAALAAIRAEAEAEEDRDVVSLDRRRRLKTRWTRAAWVPLAAAAALAAVLVFGPDDPFPTDGEAPPPTPAFEPRVAVTPPADRAAAIMETENPNITIVWLYEREES